MNKYLSIMFSAIFFLIVFNPCQVLAASIREKQAEIGYACTASGDYSTAMGNKNKANGDSSTAMGELTIADGYSSTAMGGLTWAYGQSSTAMGSLTYAQGESSTAMGVLTVASGIGSTAMGGGTTASGIYSTAMGSETIAYTICEMVIGAYSTKYQPTPSATPWTPTDRLFVIGNGTKNDARSDALVVLKSGNIGMGTSVPRHILDLGSALGKKLAVYQGPDGNSFYGFGISSNTLEIYAGADVNDGPAMVVKKNTGRVGIGMSDPKYKLDVSGDIRATGSVYYGYILPDGIATPYIKPDYVFEDGYKIMSTEQVAEHLEREKSLPWITSLKQEKEENGALIDMTRMSFETVEAVENLQIQIIELSKLIKELKPKNEALKAENNALREGQRNQFKKQQAEIEELRSMIRELKS